MKKKVTTIIIILIILLLGGYFTFKSINENNLKYQVAEINDYNYFVLKSNGKYGVIDKTGNIIISSEYDDVKIPNPEKPIFVCYNGNNTKILNEKNEEVLQEYKNVEPIRLTNIASDLMYEKSVFKYEENGKYGIVSFEGKKITNAIYEELESLPYKEGQLQIKQDGKYGVINIKGKKIIPNKYDKIVADGYYTDENQYDFAGYIVSLTTDEGYRYGYINYNRKKILDVEYNDMSRVNEISEERNSYIICAKNGQYGVMKNGEQVIPNEYQSIRYDSSNKVFVVEKSKKYGIVNISGKEIVPTQYNQIDITGIYLYAQNEQGTTVYNSNGTQANINANISILNTENEKYRIRINTEDGKTRYGVVDKEGKQLIKEKYSYITYLYNNHFIVSNENGKLGVINDKENEEIEIKYDSLQKIQGTELLQATLSDEESMTIFSKDMKEICKINNAKIEQKDEYIKIYNDKEQKYFSKEGEELKNTDIYKDNKLFAKSQNDKWGFVDKNNNVKVDFKYDKVTEFNKEGFAAVCKDGKWGSINDNGEEVVEPKYEINTSNEPSFIGKYYQVIYGFGEIYYTDDK